MMKAIAKPIGLLSLVGTIVPPLLFMFQKLDLDPMKNIMLVSCVLWFITAPMWMKAE
jgi:hypothetical protein